MNDEAMSAVDAAAGVMQRGMQAGRSVPGAELAEADLTISVRVK